MDGNSSDREGEKPPESGGGGSGGGGAGEPRVRRKMKTAAQLEALERTYKVDTYPPESVRAELSVQLGLSDRQLQMWFCHRRLKDRKTSTTITNNNNNNNNNSAASTPPPPPPSKRARKGEALPATTTAPPPSTSAAVVADEMGGACVGSGSGSGSSPYGHLEHRHRGGVPRTGVAVPRISHGRYYESLAQPPVEVRAIAYVEAQLGEPLREDGPALGIEFDPLPPGAFGAPIVPIGVPKKQPGRVYEPNSYERPDVKAKGHGRALCAYQFLPEQPSVQSDAYERVAQPHYYGSPSDGLITRTPVLSTGRSYMHGREEVPSYGQLPNLSLMSHQGKHSHHLASASEEYDGITRKSPYPSMPVPSMPVESPFSSHPTAGLDVDLVPPERPSMHDDDVIRGLVPPERPSVHDDDVIRLERKRKSEEVRMQKEVEAHEKRMKKELEKQDILRRKREEQMRKEMERHDRERRKEEERMLREKQREVERYQKEQRKETERREKNLMKESIRVEKLRQKDELRREKEAARQKAANDRAAARRIAKESTELIEDERLELMEIAATRKGLPSILALDSEISQNLDTFRDLLREFPPKTVQLKRPFSIQPWTNSEENVGNLLMLWRFFITFADVLGLWPFTLDEFVQAFHDYDPRILGEVHIALLRTIIKDIEDVARTPSTGLGANQSAAVNPGGGHPHIVEGAYAWGFDITSWQQHLGPLTWLEILRQFALSAGFGPKLKKKNAEATYVCDDNEGNDGTAIISNLRNGAAVENAVAIMQEKGYSNPRRSRHRLTPGTVKFAAFHVLSLEGSKGINILEVAERIQKSGLRDLTTSKTPEASIAAALSRDTKLFERVAPSTYCVRTPYRRDPADAEALLSDAREKIRVFKSGFVDGVEAEDVEKEEDSESDTAEDPEVYDLGAALVTDKGVESSHEVKRSGADVCMENGIEPLRDGGMQNGIGNTSDALPLSCEEEPCKANVDGASVDQCDNRGSDEEVFTTNQEDNAIDESTPCEPWVQGLMEGDYSDLRVEERLKALVALIGMAIEGNSVRMVLEERLEAANVLKKQMWAEAQLDKRRLKEDHMTRSQYAPSSVNRAEANTCIGENRQSPLLVHEQKGSDAAIISGGPHEQFSDADQDRKPNPNLNPNPPLEKNTMNVESSVGPDNTVLQQSYAAAERSRAQLKSYIGHKAEEMYVYRSLALGMDRRRNRYWQFVASASRNDPCSAIIFIELHNGGWRLIDSEEAFDALLASLDVRGIRESHLHALLQRIETLFKESVKGKRLANSIAKPQEAALKSDISIGASNLDCGEDSLNSIICASNSDMPETSSSFQIEFGRNKIELENILQRYKDLEEWMWKECLMSSPLRAKKFGKKRCEQLLGVCDCCHDLFFFEDQHCPSCHNTFSASDTNINFSDHMTHCDEMLKFETLWKMKGLNSLTPVRIRLLKVLLVLLEVLIPTEALQSYWSDGYRRSWAVQLHESSSADDLLQAMTALEGAIKKDFLSPNFQTTNEILASGNPSKLSTGAPIFNLRGVAVLPWIPQTTAAVALRLMELDSAVFYTLHQKEEFRKSEDLSKIASTFSVSRKTQGNEVSIQHGEHFQEGNWLDPCSGGFGSNRSKGSGRGRVVRSRPCGGGSASARSQRRSEKLLGPVGGGGLKNRSTRGRGGSKRNYRAGKGKRKQAKKAGSSSANAVRGAVLFDESPSRLPGKEEDEDWNREVDEAVVMQVEICGVNDNSEYEDNGREFGNEDYGDMFEDDGCVGGKSSGGMLEGGSEEEDDEDRDEEEDEEEEEDVDGYVRKGYQQGGYEEEDELDVDVEGYLNAESEDDGNEDQGLRNDNRNLDRDDGSVSTSSSSEYSD